MTARFCRASAGLVGFAVLLGSLVVGQAQAVLVHHWNIEGDTAGTLTDSVGGVNLTYDDPAEGSLSADATAGPASTQGFTTATGGDATSANPDDLFMPQSFSVALWTQRLEATGSARPMLLGSIENGSGYNHNYTLRSQAPGNDLVWFSRSRDDGPSGSKTMSLSSSVDLTDGQWHYVAATLDWSGVAGTSMTGKIYVDGVETGVFTELEWDGWTAAEMTQSGIGQAGFSPIANYDDVRIYDNVLTESDIQAIMDDVGKFPSLTVDRQTGNVSIAGGTIDFDVLGYQISSANESLDQTNWVTVKGHYDALPANGGTTGDGTVDADNNWTVLSAPGSHTDLSEFELEGGDGGSIKAEGISGSPVDLGSVWTQSPVEDLTFQMTRSNGAILTLPVKYVGNDGDPLAPGDFNFDGAITSADWLIFNANHETDLSAFTLAQAYQKGDLDGDRDNDFDDYFAFKALYATANPAPGAFEAMVASVPEPTSLFLLLLGGIASVLCRMKRRVSASMAILPALVICCSLSSGVNAETYRVNFYETSPDEVVGNADWDDIQIATVGTGIAINEKSAGGSPATIDWSTGFANPNNDQAVTLSGDLGQVYKSYLHMGMNDGGVTISDLPTLPAGETWTLTVYSDINQTAVDPQNRGADLTIGHSGPDQMLQFENIDLGTATVVRHSGAEGRETVNEMVFAGLSGSEITINMLNSVVNGGAGGRTAINGFVLTSGEAPVVPELTLVVNTITGATTLKNESGGPVSFDYYRVLSPSDSLLPADGQWLSLQDQDFEGNGDPGTGDGWEEAGGVSTGKLVESYLGEFGTGQSEIIVGTSIDLGRAFNTSGQQDLVFEYHEAASGSALVATDVVYDDTPPPFVEGDYDNSGSVEQADLDLVLLNWGSTGTPPGWINDPPTSPIGSSQLDKVRQNWGASAGGVAASAVPEPSVLTLLGLALVCVAGRRRRGGYVCL